MRVDVAARHARLQLVALGLVASALTVAVRLPFLGSLSPDEGGYAYVARRWAHGASLYRGVWIDRPQGLIALYRVLVSAGNAPVVVRAGAIVLAAAIAILLLLAGTELHGRTAGGLAALMFAVAGVAPHAEGFTLNGELAAAAPATAAVACSVHALRAGRVRWFALAGLCAGGALTMKQGAFDGAVVACACACMLEGRRLRALAAAVGGIALPVAGCLALGAASVGLHAYAEDLAGYQLGSQSVSGQLLARAHALGAHLGSARDLLGLAVVAAVGTALSRSRHQLRIPLLWLVAAASCVNIGGAYWPHYFVQAIPPLALVAGVAVASTGRRRLAGAAALLVVGAAPVAYSARVAAARDRTADILVPYAQGFDIDLRVARWLRRHTPPGGRIYVLSSRADVYFLADRTAAFPYIWGRPLQTIAGAEPRLARLLDERGRPRFVAEYQPSSRLADPMVGVALRRCYRPRWRTPGGAVHVLQARPTC